MLNSSINSINRAGSIAAARQGVQGASNVLGGFGTPAGYGADARGMLETANSTAQAQERRLWQAVDPDGTLALPATPIRQTAQQLLGEVNPQVGDVLSAPEQALLHGAAGLPNVITHQSAIKTTFLSYLSGSSARTAA